MSQESIMKVLMILLLCISLTNKANAANFTFSIMPISLQAAEHKSEVIIAAKSAVGVPTPLRSVSFQESGAASQVETISLLSGLASATSIRSLFSTFAHDSSSGSLQGLSRQEALGLHAKQLDTVPLSVAAWLFASALIGFVVVANRRKV